VVDRRRTSKSGSGTSMARARLLLTESGVGGDAGGRMVGVADRFLQFAERGWGVSEIQDVSAEVAAAFVRAPMPDGSPAGVSMMHMRRSTLRLLFRLAREAGLADRDPTLDLALPARSELAARPLTDDEVALCRGHSLWTLAGARRSATWALAEATCRSGELAHITVADMDLGRGQVSISGGRLTRPRLGLLTEWGSVQLRRRLDELDHDPATPIVYAGASGPRSGQVSACVAIDDVLRRAGLSEERDVRPSSIAAWAGRRILAETNRIDEVARRLGMRSLDRTARFIAWDWNSEETSA
jgi:integrase